MLRKIKASLTAMMLSSVALTSAVSVGFVLTADTAIAKSDKSKGKGKGKGNSGIGKSGNGARHADGHTTGQGQKMNRQGKGAAAGGKREKDAMHPSNLGNMNGALNANENAIAAHIRNGNTNGPIGLMAAYLTGRETTAGALEALGEGADGYIQLNEVLAENGYVDEFGNPDLEAYLDSGETAPDIQSALVQITWSEQEQLLVENGYVDALGNPDFDAYVDAGGAIAEINEASTDPNPFDVDLYADVVAAAEELAAEADAEQALVEYWNKIDTAPEGTEEALRAALDERAMELEETQSVMNALEPTDDETAECDPVSDDCAVPDEEVALATE